MSDNRISVNKTNWIIVFCLWFCGIGAAMQFAKFSISLDMLINHYNVYPTLITLTMSIVGFIGMVFGIFAGITAGKIGFLRVLIVSLFIGFLVGLAQSFLPPIPVLILTRIIEGISHLGIIVAAPTLILAVSAQKHQAITMGIWGTFFGVAYAIMGWVGVDILSDKGLNNLFGMHGLMMLLLAISIFCLSGLFKQSKGNFSKNHNFSIRNFLLEHLKVYRNKRTLLPGVIFFFHTCLYIAFLTFLPGFSDNPTIKALLLIILPLISIVGTFIAGLIIQYIITAPNLLIISYIGLFINSFLAIAFIDKENVFFAFSALILLFSGCIQGASFALIPYLSKSSDEQSQSNGSVAQFGNLGATIGSPVFILIMQLFNINGLVLLILLLSIFGVVFSALTKGIHGHKAVVKNTI